ncbi:MAG TPA: zinc-binding dehydrogenase [Bryobacteraceae bacterium]|nr:zinc-binding dehydrogenase [Bryobacteraceae bacterium]
MRAMVLRAPGDLTLDDVALPQAPSGHVLVRITHSGLCGTDLKIYKGAIPAQYPLIMGHEMVGELAGGGRVIIDPVLSCGTCFHCRLGQTNLCPAGGLIGRETNGGFAEYAAVPASQIFRLPDSIESAGAPLIQVATTCLHAQRLAQLSLGESVAVIGLGVSGQLHVQLAKARGAGQVIGISRSRFKNDLARQMGADVAIESGPTALAQVLEATEGRGADVVIECTGVMTSIADAIRMARFGGRIVLFGITSATSGTLPFYDLYFKELTLINNRAATAQDFPVMINLVDRGVVRLEPLVTHRMALEELGTALGMVEDSAEQRLKIILDHT